MSRLVPNWKRNVFFTSVAVSSSLYLYDFARTTSLMKYKCRIAADFGDKKLPQGSRPRHITVILNPVAGKGNSKKLYQKWVEPLLHLAGIKVSLIETSSPDQAYGLMKVMSNCDGVAIVGGDGTVSEALNGLLSRSDRSNAIKEFPIGIIPTGQFNSIARLVHAKKNYYNRKEFLIESTMSLVESCKKKYDILQISPLSSDRKRDPNSTIYALRELRYGIYQDDYLKIGGFQLYQTNIKPYWSRVKKVFSNKCPRPMIERLSYTEPCEGCSKCYDKQILENTPNHDIKPNPSNRRWWSLIATGKKSVDMSNPKLNLELAKRINPSCGIEKTVDMANNITDFRASAVGEKTVTMSIRRERNPDGTEFIEAQDVRLKVASHLDEKHVSRQNKLDESEQQPCYLDSKTDSGEKKPNNEDSAKTKFLIDRQPVQIHSVEITAIREAVTLFSGIPKIDIE